MRPRYGVANVLDLDSGEPTAIRPAPQSVSVPFPLEPTMLTRMDNGADRRKVYDGNEDEEPKVLRRPVGGERKFVSAREDSEKMCWSLKT